jgi:hypothetical protein
MNSELGDWRAIYTFLAFVVENDKMICSYRG